MVPWRVIREVRRAVRPLYWGLAGLLPITLRRHFLYLARLRRLGSFSEPVTFNEKVNWRVLNDRRPQVADACDKLKMKEVARAALPESVLRIPRTLWTGDDMASLPDLAALPPWVLKPNNGSGRVLLGSAGTTRDELAGSTRGWLRSQQSERLGEWGYTRARSCLLVEERIGSGPQPPVDYKFFVFDGVPRVIQVNSGRASGRDRATFYDPSWHKLPVRWVSQPTDDLPAPPELPRMLDVAAHLGADWDFLRVDLYAVGGEVWFGEFTPYPGGGVVRYEPAGFDALLGSHWTLPADDRVRAP